MPASHICQSIDNNIAQLSTLPESQAGSSRHKCAACAYEGGSRDALLGAEYPEGTPHASCEHGNRAPIAILDNLPVSQAGAGRHRCCVCAYARGFTRYALKSAGSELADSKKLHSIPLQIPEEVPPPTTPIPKDKKTPASNRDTAKRKHPVSQPDAALGLFGEKLALLFERNRLENNGFGKLVRDVRHVSQEIDGNSAGYDIHSWDAAGVPRHIEVKTTAAGILTPFFISQNEVNFSSRHPSTYFIYRIFDATSQPKIFIQRGDVTTLCQLTPTMFRASWK
jgi:hypothetical protein